MVREYQPKGYANWTEFYLSKKRRAVIEQLKILAIVGVLFAGYCIVGTLEYAV